MRKIHTVQNYINFLFFNKKAVFSFFCRRSISLLTITAYLNLTLSPCFAEFGIFREGEKPHSYRITLQPVSQDINRDKVCLKVTGKWKNSEERTVSKEFPYFSNVLKNHETHEVSFFPGLGTLHISTNGELSLAGEGWQENLSSLVLSTFAKTSLEGFFLDTLEVNAPTVYMKRKNESKFLKIVSDGIVINENYINSTSFEMNAAKFINKGKVDTSEKINCKLQELDNTHGELNAGHDIDIQTSILHNSHGNICGIKGTTLTISQDFENKEGIIGVVKKNSKTCLNFTGSPTINDLGDIRGRKISLSSHVNNTPIILKNGNVSAKKVISVIASHLNSANVNFHTPSLYLDVDSFSLSDQTDCERTIVGRHRTQNFKLSHPYRTKGTFEIWEKGLRSEKKVVSAFNKRFQNRDLFFPQAEHKFEICATLQADQGVGVYAPAATLHIRSNWFNWFSKSPLPELLLQNSYLKTYISKFDLEEGKVAAQNAEIHAPLGVKIGRLIQDNSQEVFSTLFAHSQCNYSHHLGHYIKNANYTIVDGNKKFIYDHKSVYDDRHLFRLPVFIPNSSVFWVNGKLSCEGPLHHQGSLLQAKELVIDSSLDSFCKSSKININGDLSLKGGGKFILDRVVGKLGFQYYHHLCPSTNLTNLNFNCVSQDPVNWCFYSNLAYTFVNSEPSECRVEGKLRSDSQCSILNKGSILYAGSFSPGILLAPQNIKTDLYQRFIGGTIEERDNISLPCVVNQGNTYNPIKYDPKNPLAALFTGFSSDILIGSALPIKINNIYNSNPKHAGIAKDDQNRGDPPSQYVRSFLLNTNNFAGAQQAFPAETSSVTGAVLSADNTKFGGHFSTPSLLISVGKGGLVLGSPNPYYIEKRNPICRLLDKGFNLQTTYVTPDLKVLIEKERNTPLYKPFFQPFFKFQELYFFNKESADNFYQEIKEHVNFLSPEGTFKKSDNVATVFSLSPNLLIGRIQEQCQKALGRGYIYENSPIDDKFVQELHRNTTEYLQTYGLTGNVLEKSLISNNPHFSPPSKPLIYYMQSTNEQGLQELEPYLILPPSIIDQARGKQGDHINTRFLGIFPEGMSPEQLINYFKGDAHLQRRFIECLKINPTTMQYLTNQATEQSFPPDKMLGSSFGKVRINGSVTTEKMAVVAPETLEICGSIEVQDAFLSSLFSDVHIRSLIERIYEGNSENFYDHILSNARIAAKEILTIISGGDVIFEGAETHSGSMGTHIEALGKIYDIPIKLVTQRLKNFCGSTHGKERITSFFQKCSSHTSDGTIDWVTHNGLELYAPIIAAKKFYIRTEGSLKTYEVHDIEEHEVAFHRKGRWLQGDKHHHEVRSSSCSKGIQISTEEMEVESEGLEVILTNPTLEIKKGVIQAPFSTVSVKLGTNHCTTNKSTQNSSVWWQSSQQDHGEHFTYSNPSIASPIHISSKEAILQTVRGHALSYLENIRTIEREPVKEFLDEYHCNETKKIQGPGIALSSLITLIVAIGTQGTGASIAQTLFSVSEPFQVAMWNVGVTAVCKKAAVSLVSHQGDIKGVFEDLTSEEFLKSFMTTVGTAGLSKFMIDKLKLSTETKDFLDHFKVTALKASIGAGFAAALHGYDFAKEFRESIINSEIDSLGGYLAAQIGAAFPLHHEIMDFTTHKLLHGVLGSALGAITNEDRKSGAFAGALGAIVAETVADIITDNPVAIIEKIVLQADKEGKILTSQELRERCEAYLEGDEYKEYLTTRKNIALFAAANAAALMEVDVNTATYTALNALENNFHPTVILSARISWEIYALAHEEELEKLRDDICKTVAETVGCDKKIVEFIYDTGMWTLAPTSSLKKLVKNTVVNTTKIIAKKAKNTTKKDKNVIKTKNNTNSSTTTNEETSEPSKKRLRDQSESAETTLFSTKSSKLTHNNEDNIIGGTHTQNTHIKENGGISGTQDQLERAVGKGVNNPKTKKGLDYGNKKHKEYTEKTESMRTEKSIFNKETKNYLYPDLVTEKMVHELKPASVTGVKKGLIELPIYENVSGKPGLLHLYTPEGKSIDIDNIVQKNFRSDPIVKKVLEIQKKTKK